MEMAFLGEILTPSRCGRMDQCCAFGAIPHVMTFDGDLLMTEPIAPPLEPVHLVVVDLGGEKDTLEILNSLNKAYPIAEDELQRGVQRLHRLLLLFCRPAHAIVRVMISSARC